MTEEKDRKERLFVKAREDRPDASNKVIAEEEETLKEVRKGPYEKRFPVKGARGKKQEGLPGTGERKIPRKACMRAPEEKEGGFAYPSSDDKKEKDAPGGLGQAKGAISERLLIEGETQNQQVRSVRKKKASGKQRSHSQKVLTSEEGFMKPSSDPHRQQKTGRVPGKAELPVEGDKILTGDEKRGSVLGGGALKVFAGDVPVSGKERNRRAEQVFEKGLVKGEKGLLLSDSKAPGPGVSQKVFSGDEGKPLLKQERVILSSKDGSVKRVNKPGRLFTGQPFFETIRRPLSKGLDVLSEKRPRTSHRTNPFVSMLASLLISVLVVIASVFLGIIGAIDSARTSYDAGLDKMTYALTKYHADSEDVLESIYQSVYGYGMYHFTPEGDLQPFLQYLLRYKNDSGRFVGFESFAYMDHDLFVTVAIMSDLAKIWEAISLYDLPFFERAQQEYLYDTYYVSVEKEIEKECGIDLKNAPYPVKGAIFSVTWALADRYEDEESMIEDLFTEIDWESRPGAILIGIYRAASEADPEHAALWSCERNDMEAMQHGRLDLYEKSENDFGHIDWRRHKTIFTGSAPPDLSHISPDDHENEGITAYDWSRETAAQSALFYLSSMREAAERFESGVVLEEDRLMLTECGGEAAMAYTERMIECVLSGLPYVWGGSSLETGADCSGFVWAVMKEAGVFAGVPRLTSGQFQRYGAEVFPSLTEGLRVGDVLYWTPVKGSPGSPRPGHVAVYCGRGFLVHAADPAHGTVVSRLSDTRKGQGYRVFRFVPAPEVP